MYNTLKIRADIYHFHDPELFLVSFLIRWLFFRKVVFDMRESTARQILSKEYLPKWSRKTVSLLYRITEKIFLQGISVIVANDRSVEENKSCYLVRNFPVVDKELMKNALPIYERLKNPLIIYVGGVWETRGALIYLNLAKELMQRGHKFRMMIIGPCSESYRKFLNDKIEKLNLGNIVSITGRMDYLEAMKLAAQAVIGLSILLPSPNYTFCLSGKIIEYMMCGTPVLTSNFDHWEPYVAGENAGLLVDPHNLEEIVNKCERMLKHPMLLEEMSRNGIKSVIEKYNWDIEFKKLIKCYEDLLGMELLELRK